MARKRNPNAPYWLTLQNTEKSMIEGALKETGGSFSRAADILGVNRAFLQRRAAFLGVDPGAYRFARKTTGKST